MVYTNSSSGIVRFYAIPEESGNYGITAVLGFTYDGAAMAQPIGTAYFTGTAMTITAPSKTASKTIVVSGKAIPQSTITVYADDSEAAMATANSAGTWSCEVELQNTYSISAHNVYAVVSSYGATTESETKLVRYRSDYISLSDITMINSYSTRRSECRFDQCML